MKIIHSILALIFVVVGVAVWAGTRGPEHPGGEARAEQTPVESARRTTTLQDATSPAAPLPVDAVSAAERTEPVRTRQAAFEPADRDVIEPGTASLTVDLGFEGSLFWVAKLQWHSANGDMLERSLQTSPARFDGLIPGEGELSVLDLAGFPLQAPRSLRLVDGEVAHLELGSLPVIELHVLDAVTGAALDAEQIEAGHLTICGEIGDAGLDGGPASGFERELRLATQPQYLGVVPADRSTLWIEADIPGYEAQASEQVTRDAAFGRVVVMELQPEPDRMMRVTGIARRLEDGVGVAGVRVHSVPALAAAADVFYGPVDLEVAGWTLAGRTDERRSTTTDAEGRFELVFRAPDNGVRVEAIAPGYQLARSETLFADPGGPPTELELSLTAGCELSGRLIGDLDDDLVIESLEVFGESRYYRCLPAETGEYRIVGIEPGHYEVSLSGRATGSTGATGERAQLAYREIDLAPGEVKTLDIPIGSESGSLRMRGSLQLPADFEMELGGVIWIANSRDVPTSPAQLGPDGEFELHAVQPLDSTVLVVADAEQHSRRALIWRELGRAAFAESEWTFTLPATELSIELGRDRAGAEVRIEPVQLPQALQGRWRDFFDDQPMLASIEGRVVLAGVTPGDYLVRSGAVEQVVSVSGARTQVQLD